MEIEIIGTKNKLPLAEEVFSCVFNEPLVHQIVVAYLAAGRAGTHAQKNRAAVRGGGIKPWRQKGTGRARAGTIRSPIWRKGGVTFAAKPTNYAQKVNKKMYRGALRAIFSELLRTQRLIVMEELKLETSKTKDFIKRMASLDVACDKLLIILETVDVNLYLASRNLPYVEVQEPASVNPVSLIGANKVIITAAALKKMEESLK